MFMNKADFFLNIIREKKTYITELISSYRDKTLLIY